MLYFFRLITLFVFFLSTNVYAIVSMQSLHLEEPVPGWKGGFNLDLSGAEGNTEQFRINTGAMILNHHNSITRFLTLKYTYGESFGIEDQRKAYLHLRRIHILSNKWAWELFGQLENNKFSRLNLRALLGTGGRYKLFSSPENTVFTGFGGFYSAEYLDDLANDNSNNKDKTVKGNFYLIYKHDFSKSAQFVSTTYAQPTLNDFHDFRLLEEASLNFKLTTKTLIKVTLEVIHDNDPPLSVKKTDINYLTGIELNF